MTPFIPKLGAYLLSMGILFVVAITRPDHATCPTGTFTRDGIRGDGSYMCRPPPVCPSGGHDCETKAGRGTRDTSIEAGEPLEGRIYCTGGQWPIIVNESVVGCEARH